MINYKHGNIQNLHQLNSLGFVKASENVVAGMVVSLDSTTGEVVRGAPADKLAGFAMNTQPIDITVVSPTVFTDNESPITGDGDVIATGKIGIFHSNEAVVETNVSAVTITAGNYPVGAPVYAAVGASVGYITNSSASSARKIGTVYGIGTIRGKAVVAVKLDLQ